MSALKAWLISNRLEKYLDVLEANSVDLDVMSQLTEADLAELGIPLGDRKRLMMAAGRGTPATPPPAPEGFGEAAPAFPETETETEAARPRPIGELRQMTLMFVDLVNSTGLVQELGLERYRDTLKAFQACNVEAIRENFGYFAQFIGDGVVAYFGFPAAREDDAERAVLTALEIVRDVGAMTVAPGTQLAVRVGIATGDVLVEDLMQGARPVDHFALGNIPNLAARLQSLAQPGQVAITGRTRRLLGRNFECGHIGKRALKGFAEPVDVWLVEGVHETELRFDKRRPEALTPMIGREDEFRLLEGRWNAACRGESQAVFLSGEAGLGKSRLAEEVYARLVLPDARRLSFQCSPYHQSSAFYPVKSHLYHAIGLTEADTPRAREEKIDAFLAESVGASDDITAVYANFLSLGEKEVSGPAAPEEIKARTVETLLRYVQRAAEEQPVLILFEDLHWVDPSSEELIDTLIDRMNGLPVMLLGTYRPEYQPRWQGKSQVTTLSLPGLGKRQTEALVRSLFKDTGILDGLIKPIVSRSEGVPLFVEEMVRMLSQEADSGLIDPKTGLEHLLPSNLKDLLRARLDHLTVTPDTVSICATLGRSFSTALVAAVSERGVGEVEAELQNLCQAQILVPRSQVSESGYSFRHALIRDVAYEAILPRRARELHRRIAGTLVRDFPFLTKNNPELLAQHYSRAGMFEDARARWQEAAAIALRNHAGHEAIAHLDAALEAHAQAAPGEAADLVEIELRQMLSVALEIRAWGSPDIAVNLERLAALQSKIGDLRDAFSVLHQLCGRSLIAGRPDVAWDYCERIAELLGADADAAMLTLAEHNSGMASLLLGRFDRAIAHFDRALSLREEADLDEIGRYYPADPRTIDMVMRCWAGALNGQDRGATETELAAALKAARDDASDFSRCFALGIIATIHCTLDEPEDARRLAGEAHAISEKNQFQYWEAWSSIVLGWAEARCGDPDTGITGLRDGLQRYLATGSAQIVTFANTLLADAYLSRNEVTEAAALIKETEAALKGSATGFHRRMTERVAEKVAAQAQEGAGNH